MILNIFSNLTQFTFSKEFLFPDQPSLPILVLQIPIRIILLVLRLFIQGILHFSCQYPLKYLLFTNYVDR